MLHLVGGPVERLAHERLKVLRCSLIQTTLSAPDLVAIKRGASGTFPGAYNGDFALPALEELSWMLGEQDEILGDRRSIFHRPPPGLHVLELTGSTENLHALAGCDLMKQLRELDLYVSGDLEALLALAPSLTELETLTVRGSKIELEHGRMLELRAALERALPKTKLKISWDRLVGGGRIGRAPTGDSDGHVDAIGAFIDTRST
jgi:hypothetical protein